ncbi:hypothetical protein PG984_012375 [Apiospora sp. TS-2023a]
MARYYYTHVLSLLAVLSGVVSPPLVAEAAVQAQPPPPPAADTATFTSTCPTTQTRTITHTLTQTITLPVPVTQGGSFNEPGSSIDTTCTGEGTGVNVGVGTATLTSHHPIVTDTTYRVISTETQTSSFTFFPAHNETVATGPTAGTGASTCTEEFASSSSSLASISMGVPVPTTSSSASISMAVPIPTTSATSEVDGQTASSATITAPPASTSDSPPTSYPTTSTTPLPVTAGSTALQAWSWYMKAPGGMGMFALMLLAGLI